MASAQSSFLVIAGLDPAIHRLAKKAFWLLAKSDGPAGQARG
jgi:hypothetical protein